MGLLKVKVIKGTNLAVRDMKSSDPFITLTLGQQVSSNSHIFEGACLYIFLIGLLQSKGSCENSKHSESAYTEPVKMLKDRRWIGFWQSKRSNENSKLVDIENDNDNWFCC